MAGSYYIALSGMRARLHELDRLATDLANASTAGYKAERGTTEQADRADFSAVLKSAIDVANTTTRTDLRPGEIASTGRELDAAIEGPGMFAVTTPGGTRYTRTGRFVHRADGILSTTAGMALEGADGKPIKVGTGTIQLSADGTVKADGAEVGKLKIVEFARPEALTRESSELFRSDEPAPPAAVASAVRAGALELSNVSVIERMTELTSVSRNFATLERALSLLANDVDLKAITELGRR